MYPLRKASAAAGNWPRTMGVAIDHFCRDAASQSERSVLDHFQPRLVTFLKLRVEEEQALSVLVLGPALDAPRGRHVLQTGRPVGADRGVDALFLHRCHKLPGFIDGFLIDVGEIGPLVLRFELAVEAHHVHPALGQEPGVMGKVLRGSIALNVGGHTPEPHRRAVAQDERLAVRAQPDEPALTGDLLVQVAEVEHGFRAGLSPSTQMVWACNRAGVVAWPILRISKSARRRMVGRSTEVDSLVVPYQVDGRT